jgi:hypothetical protein
MYRSFVSRLIDYCQTATSTATAGIGVTAMALRRNKMQMRLGDASFFPPFR